MCGSRGGRQVHPALHAHSAAAMVLKASPYDSETLSFLVAWKYSWVTSLLAPPRLHRPFLGKAAKSKKEIKTPSLPALQPAPKGD